MDFMKILKEKTKGNISTDIKKALDGMISELSINYMDEKSKVPEKTDEKKKEEPLKETNRKKEITDGTE